MVVRYEGQEFFDDRLTVSLIAPCVLERESDDLFKTTIYHERVREGVDASWCVMVMLNTAGYRLIHLLNVPTEEFARTVHEIVECSTPFASLDGRRLPPEKRGSLASFRSEMARKGIAPFSYEALFSPGGENAQEVVMQTAEQFFKDVREVKRILNF